MPNTKILVIRFGIFGLSCLLSLPIIALCLHSGIIMEQTYGPGFIFYQTFGVATAGVTLAMCMIFGITGLVWRNAWLSMNIVEISILVGISVMWIFHAIVMNTIVGYHGGFSHYDYIDCVLYMEHPGILCRILQKEPERIAQPVQPVQYAYYIPNHPSYFQPQASLGVPPVDPFILPSAHSEPTTNIVNQGREKSSLQRLLVHQQPVERNTSPAQLPSQTLGLDSPPSNHSPPQLGLVEQPAPAASMAPISQITQQMPSPPPNSQEAQMHIAELTSRVDMLTRELQRMGRSFSPPPTYHSIPTYNNAS
ncbi:hypothetical protein L218DRAFT_949689 [Marasmius fiardii PR-910]|nr:hypothetical protein L218DRAFT_949689 [Marasmius fiardii PR-910]